MIYAIIALTIAVIYLWASKASLACVQHSCDTTNRTNMLYRAYISRIAEEYKTLKGYNFLFVETEYCEFREDDGQTQANASIRPYNYIKRREIIKNAELEQRLEQLKADMKRGCEIYCKENV